MPTCNFWTETLTHSLGPYPRRGRKMGSCGLLSSHDCWSVISPFCQGNTGSAQMQTGSEPGCTDAGDPLSQAGKRSRWTTSLLCLQLLRDKEESWVVPSKTKWFCRFRMWRNPGKIRKWQNTRKGACMRIKINSLLAILLAKWVTAFLSLFLFLGWILKSKGQNPDPVYLPPSTHPCSKSQSHLGPSHPFHLVKFYHKYLSSNNFESERQRL